MPEARLKTIGANRVSFPVFYQARGSCPLEAVAQNRKCDSLTRNLTLQRLRGISRKA
ncbi:MAG: hypothetical protein F6K26_35745 [Moorea sp. SIO2I5]|nr:hypothetical protein [Moorena sp. SIO2I5]